MGFEMSDKRPLALGRTAEIYPWERGWILKLFHEWVSGESVEHEAGIARLVHGAGLPVPAVGAVVEMRGRVGLVYERVDGPTMLEEIVSKPWSLLRSARLLAELQAKVHAVGWATGLPSQHKRLEGKIRQAQGLDPILREAKLRALQAMPVGDRLCHGDFHPGNVIITPRGPIVIDWADATQGNPLADVARSALILLGAKASVASPVQKVMLAWYHQAYLRRTFELRRGGKEEAMAWYPIVAAARMSEGIAEIQDWLHVQVATGPN
jgi:aminoglycoside phosphotransferase (APT) family kinase protein